MASVFVVRWLTTPLPRMCVGSIRRRLCIYKLRLNKDRWQAPATRRKHTLGFPSKPWDEATPARISSSHSWSQSCEGIYSHCFNPPCLSPFALAATEMKPKMRSCSLESCTPYDGPAPTLCIIQSTSRGSLASLWLSSSTRRVLIRWCTMPATLWDIRESKSRERAWLSWASC